MAGSSASGKRTPESENKRPANAATREAEKAPTDSSAPSVHPVEPSTEPRSGQAAESGHTQQRRVLGLNVDGHQAERHPETPAGQHATGSFGGNDGSDER